MLARSQKGSTRACLAHNSTQERGGGAFESVGLFMDTLITFSTVRAAVRAVDEHYDRRLHSALHARGWKPHLDSVVASALHNGKKVTLRSVIRAAWSRRRSLHTAPPYRVVAGRRVCALCQSSGRLGRYRE